MGDEYTRKDVSDYLNRTVQGETITTAESALREQASYRKGWEAGERKANAEIKALKDLLEYANEQWRMWRNKAQGFERPQDAMKRCHPGENNEPQSDIPEVGITEMHVMGPGGYSKTFRVDLDRMRYENMASSDRAASKALVEQEPWHAGIDPDEP